MNTQCPFGTILDGRTFSSAKYRYGFNGKEKDDEVKGAGNQQDYGARIYDNRLGRFLSVDPLQSKFAYLSSYQFAGNTPIQAIDIDGLEPQSVVTEKYRTTSIISYNYSDDPPDTPPIRVEITVVTYKYTDAAAHLLSKVSGISEDKIKNVEIRNAEGSMLPAYDPMNGGGAMTFPSGEAGKYRMNFTNNYFSPDNKKFKGHAKGISTWSWMHLSSHEVGHIKDIDQIGQNKLKYFSVFIAEYAQALDHDTPRELDANKGRDKLVGFNSFVNNKMTGSPSLTSILESKVSQQEQIKQIDNLFKHYENYISQGSPTTYDPSSLEKTDSKKTTK